MEYGGETSMRVCDKMTSFHACCRMRKEIDEQVVIAHDEGS